MNQVDALNSNSYQNTKMSLTIIFILFTKQLVSDTVFLTICLLLTIILCIRYSRNIASGIIPGFGSLIIIGIVSVIIGLFHGYSYYRLFRSISYYLTGIISIFLGALLVRRYRDYSIEKTILLSETIVTIYCFVSLIIAGGFSNYITIRSSMSVDIVSLEFVFPIFLANKFLYKQVYFTKKIDNTLFTIMLIRIIISLSRTTIVGVFVGLIVMLLSERHQRERFKTFFLIVSLILFAIVGLVILYSIAPTSIKAYLDKTLGTFSELSTRNSYLTYSDALSNWRPYENHQGIQQWVGYNLFEKLFGQGFGSLINMPFMPVTWNVTDFYQDNGIPVLHNGYITVLCLFGIFGLLAYILFFIKNITLCIRAQKTIGNSKNDTSVLLLVIIMAVNMYVIRGLYSENLCLSWGILVAYYYTNMIREMNEKMQ